MISRFTVSGDSLSNPSSAQTLIARSTDAADTMNLTIVGATSAPASVTETRALTGKREVSFATNTLATFTGAQLASAAAGTVKILQQGTKASGDIRVDDQPANNETLTIGLTGFTQVYTFKSALTPAANEIAIGADKYVTAQNICRAINAGSGSGTSYGGGTAANSYVAAYADSGFTDSDLNGTSEVTIYIRDLIPCSRLLTWSVSTTAVNLSLRAPSGGVDGTTLGTISAGDTAIYIDIDLWTPDVTDPTLWAQATPTTDAIRLRGKPCTIHVRCENVSSAIQLRIETSDDGTNWASRAATYAITNADNNEQWIAVDEAVEYLRLVITANANTTDSALHCACISQ